jgi:hypothetical protein
MFELIFAVVCLAVLAVEIIEVRHKCEECYPRPWDNARPSFSQAIGQHAETSETGR